MAQMNSDVSIPLLATLDPPDPEPISLPTAFLLGAYAVSYLLTGYPSLETFPVARLLTARQRLHHLHIASAAIQDDPQDLLRVLGILMRD
jgi:hypothetical protein